MDMNSMQAQILGMVAEEVKADPALRVVFLAVGDMKMSTEALKDGCVSSMVFEPEVTKDEDVVEMKKQLNIPDVKWEDIGGLEHVREEVRLCERGASV